MKNPVLDQVEQILWITWAVGLFEGEGCIVAQNKNRAARFQMAMADEDLIRKFHSIVGCGVVRGPYNGGKYSKKPQWQWHACRAEDAAKVWELFRPWLSERRRKRYEEINGHYEAILSGEVKEFIHPLRSKSVDY